MKFSVVTISFNQARFLKACMDSILGQEGVELEYIICDPGSTDGSRKLIESYDDPRIIRVFEKDAGPADGLNKGFERATGDIFYYLNSDDVVRPGAFAKVARFFEANPDVDVALGHAHTIDAEGKEIRRIWSEPFWLRAFAVGAVVQIQPSTFFRGDLYRKTDGFDVDDRASWDTGLLAKLHLAGGRFEVIDEFLSCFRLYDESITGSGRLQQMQVDNMIGRFEALMGRPYDASDRRYWQAMRLFKHMRWPNRTLERLTKGAI